MKQSNKVKAFLKEVEELCSQYEVNIEHEDIHGSFVISDRRSSAEGGQWFLDAQDETRSVSDETITGLEVKVRELEATLATVRSDYVEVLDRLRKKEVDPDDSIPF